MRILFITAETVEDEPGTFTLGPAAHYRFELPGAALAQLGGNETAIGRRYLVGSDGHLFTRDLEAPDVVVVQDPIPGEHAIAARRAGQAVVFDVQDGFEYPSSHLRRQTMAAGTAAAKALIPLCDAVTVSTPYLSSWLRRELPGCPPIHLLRNAVHLDEWAQVESDDRLVLGWNGRIGRRADDLSVLRPWLGDFLERHDLRFVHVGHEKGAPSFAEAADIAPERVEIRTGRSFADFLATRPLAGVNVQLIPLCDHPFSHAKSALKGMESAAMGIPFVASPQDEYKWLGCGRLAGTDLANQKPKFWIAALEAMLDPAERFRMAVEARERVAQEDIRVRWKDWENVYTGVLGV